MLGVQKRHVRVGLKLAPAPGRHHNKRIVVGVNHQRRNRDPLQHVRRTGLVVVIGRAGKAHVARRDAIIELPHRVHALQQRRIEAARPECGLAAIAPAQRLQEPPLIDPVGRLVNPVGGQRQVAGWRDHRRSHHFRRSLRPPPPQRAQHLVAAHGKAHQRHPPQTLARGHLGHQLLHVLREAGVIQRRGKMLGAATAANIHPHHVPALPPGPAAGSNHIARFAGALQPVHDDQCQPLLPLRLPVAVAQNPHLRLNRAEPLLGFGQPVGPPHKVSGNRLGMAATQKTVRHKIIHHARGVGRMGDELRTVHECSQGRLPSARSRRAVFWPVPAAHPYNECISSAWAVGDCGRGRIRRV